MTEFFSILANDPIAFLELCAVVLSFAYLLRLLSTELGHDENTLHPPVRVGYRLLIPGGLPRLFNVGVLVPLPKQSLRTQRVR